MLKQSRKAQWLSAFFAVAVILVVSGAAHASGGGGEVHGGALGIPSEKWWDLVWRTMNFACLVIILVWALKKPFSNGLTARRQSIRDQFEDLEAQRAEAEQKYKEFENKLSAIDQETTSILEAARTQGEIEKKRIIEDANRASEDIKRQAEMAVQYELAEATKLLREEIAEQAVAAAEKIIKKNLQAEDQDNLIDDYLAKVGGLKQ